MVAAALMCFACGDSSKTVTVTVNNPIDLDRTNEMVEVSMEEVSKKLSLADTAQFVVLDAEGAQVPYQVTHDDKVIFPVSVSAKGKATYTIQIGTPESFSVTAYGRHYPERFDDVAWENDLVAFRAYGPQLQARGERAFGYDVWTKYNTTEPVVEARYEAELNPETKAKIEELKKTNPEAANELYQSVSYHVDHGNGLDCYKVGPTLGGGTNALMVNDSIIYPWAFASHEVLDNGPLRFTVKMVYNPFAVKNDKDVVETRIISLDSGSYLNKAVVSFANLSTTEQVVTGLVLHEPESEAVVAADAKEGYITYVDPTDNPAVDNGKIFVGAAFPNALIDAKVVMFSEAEKNELRGGADGHVLAISDYKPGSDYVYYFGSAWSKAAITTINQWNEYVADFTKEIRNPLTVTLK